MTPSTRRILAIATEFDRVETEVLIGVAQAGIGVDAMVSSRSQRIERLEEGGIDVSILDCRSRFDVRAVRTIRGVIRDGRYGVIHCFSNRTLSNATLALFGSSIKRVAYRGTVGHLSRWDPLSWLTYLHPTLTRIVCVSNAVEEYLSQLVPRDRLATIYKGHDPEWYPHSDRRDLSSFGIPDDAFVIACVANMRPVKGVRYLLDAIDAVPEGSNVHLLLIGKVDSETERNLRANRRYPGRIHSVGFYDQPSTLVSQADCFVMPSIDREGLPKALLEAMCVGVTPIATKVGGMPEVVQDGVNGLVVPPRDSGAIRDAVVRLLENPGMCRALGGQALSTMKTRLHVSESIRRNIELYQELLGCE